MLSRIGWIILMVWGSTGQAAEMARSSSGFMFDEAQIHQVSSRPQPSAVSSQPTAPSATPAQQGTGRGCIPDRPYKESTPFKVFVDQINQTMTVHSLDFPEPLVFPISTGGGIKTPDPKSKVDPYCAATPEISQRVITAFETSEFQGRRDCTEEDVKSRSTLFPGNEYRSGQFGALMPNAIRIQGGKFIHSCTGPACKTLGEPVSGECIRVPTWKSAPLWLVQAAKQNTLDTSAITYKVNRYRRQDDSVYSVPQIEISETLAKQMRKYGAIDVQVGPPPPMRPRGTKYKDFTYPTRAYCDDSDVAREKQDLRDGKTPEGGFFDELTSSIGGIFDSLFGGGPSRPSPRSEGGQSPVPSVGMDPIPPAAAAKPPETQLA